MPPRIDLGLAASAASAMAGPSRTSTRARARLASHRSTVTFARSYTSRPRSRYASSSSAPSSSTPSPAAAAMPPSFAGLASQLSAAQPCFGAHGDRIEMIEGPTIFHDRLLEMVKSAKRRILISTLYIGTEEESLVDAVSTALAATPGLRATFVLDYNRSTRPGRGPGPSSTVHMLMPLLEKYGDRVDVWLFRSPKLKGLLERIVPPRFNEGWGTWHAKYYAVDDDVMLSGANLAASYFTNRQDRYIHLSSHPALLSYLSSITRLISDYSYKVVANARPGTLGPHGVLLRNGEPPVAVGKRGAVTASGPGAMWRERSLPPRGWAQHANATLKAFQQAWGASNLVRTRDAAEAGADTWFWPVIQAGVLDIDEEERALAMVWEAVRKSHAEGKGVDVDLTSGYFGLYSKYKRAVVDSPAPVRVIAASPKANGFYGSKGISRLIPEGYTLLESRFYADAARKGRVGPRGVRLQEWERDGWTYHAKGMWVSEGEPEPLGSVSGSPPGEPSVGLAGVSAEAAADVAAGAVEGVVGGGLGEEAGAVGSVGGGADPFLTFIGSSNLSTRSLKLDTELSLLLATSNADLRAALGHELRALRAHAHDVGPATWATKERHVSLMSRVLVALGVEGML